MRRFLIIVMMFLLPFQSVWSVAATLCAHEGPDAAHFGHHEHRHHAAGASNTAQSDDSAAHGDSDQPGSYHPDCGVCHGVGAAVSSVSAEAGKSWIDREFTGSYSAYLAEPPVEAFLRPPLSLVS